MGRVGQEGREGHFRQRDQPKSRQGHSTSREQQKVPCGSGAEKPGEENGNGAGVISGLDCQELCQT